VAKIPPCPNEITPLMLKVVILEDVGNYILSYLQLTNIILSSQWWMWHCLWTVLGSIHDLVAVDLAEWKFLYVNKKTSFSFVSNINLVLG
jgi:hypothetical protein